MKKKAPALQHVHKPLLQVLHPEQVEVEVCRSEELDHRRGLTSELDEMWSGSVTKRLLYIPVQSTYKCKTRREERGSCPPRGEADAHNSPSMP